jgi:hypothetical protein
MVQKSTLERRNKITLRANRNEILPEQAHLCEIDNRSLAALFGAFSRSQAVNPSLISINPGTAKVKGRYGENGLLHPSPFRSATAKGSR